MRILFVLHRIRRNIRSQLNADRVRGKTKYFCVGRNKTGTTSMKKAFEELGFIVGDQIEAEIIAGKDVFSGRYSKLIDYCKTAEVFQDIPFSIYSTIEHVDKAFPNSKFILTVRDGPDQWYQSLTEFHKKIYGNGGALPDCKELAKEKYPGSGLKINVMKVHGTDKKDPYNKEIMCSHYNYHNRYVIDYLKNRPDDLLVINLSEQGAYQKFLKFVGVESSGTSFPWENRT